MNWVASQFFSSFVSYGEGDTESEQLHISKESTPSPPMPRGHQPFPIRHQASVGKKTPKRPTLQNEVNLAKIIATLHMTSGQKKLKSNHVGIKNRALYHGSSLVSSPKISDSDDDAENKWHKKEQE